METLGAVLGVVILVLNFVGVLGLGIAIDHWFLTLVGYIIALGVIGNINENVMVIVIIVVSIITLIAIIVGIISSIKDNRRLKKIEQRNRELEDAIKRKDKQTVENILNEKLFNVLHIDTAVEIGDTEIVSLLLTRITDINSDDSKLLVIAVEKNDKEMVALLIDKGADVNLKYKDKTPLDYTKNEEMITLLRKHGAKTKAEIDEENRIKAEEKFFKAVEYYSKGDYSMACFYLEEAANLGHIEAHHYLGNIYGSGLGCTKDIDKAIKFFEVAANAGIINAQANLGALYFQKGRNISYDNAGAKMMAWNDGYRWSKQAADQGSTDAMFNLGIHDIETEYFDEAGKWLEKAARLGHPQALDALKELCSRGLYYVNM